MRTKPASLVGPRIALWTVLAVLCLARNAAAVCGANTHGPFVAGLNNTALEPIRFYDLVFWADLEIVNGGYGLAALPCKYLVSTPDLWIGLYEEFDKDLRGKLTPGEGRAFSPDLHLMAFARESNPRCVARFEDVFARVWMVPGEYTIDPAHQLTYTFWLAHFGQAARPREPQSDGTAKCIPDTKVKSKFTIKIKSACMCVRG